MQYLLLEKHVMLVKFTITVSGRYNITGRQMEQIHTLQKQGPRGTGFIFRLLRHKIQSGNLKALF